MENNITVTPLTSTDSPAVRRQPRLSRPFALEDGDNIICSWATQEFNIVDQRDDAHASEWSAEGFELDDDEYNPRRNLVALVDSYDMGEPLPPDLQGPHSPPRFIWIPTNQTPSQASVFVRRQHGVSVPALQLAAEVQDDDEEEEEAQNNSGSGDVFGFPTLRKHSELVQEAAQMNGASHHRPVSWWEADADGQNEPSCCRFVEWFKQDRTIILSQTGCDSTITTTISSLMEEDGGHDDDWDCGNGMERIPAPALVLLAECCVNASFNGTTSAPQEPRSM